MYAILTFLFNFGPKKGSVGLVETHLLFLGLKLIIMASGHFLSIKKFGVFIRDGVFKNTY